MFAERDPHTDTADTGDDLPAYTPVALKLRRDGWTAERQRTFLTVLAETGSILQACGEVGMSSRSAYRLRTRPEAVAFARGWDAALQLATLRLTTLAFERATRGTVKEYWRDGELVAETRSPSDKLLMFLLQHLLPNRSAPARAAALDAIVDQAREAFPRALDALVDSAVPIVPLASRDFFAQSPGDRDEDT